MFAKLRIKDGSPWVQNIHNVPHQNRDHSLYILKPQLLIQQRVASIIILLLLSVCLTNCSLSLPLSQAVNKCCCQTQPPVTRTYKCARTQLLRHTVQPLSAAQRRDETPKRLSRETEKLHRRRPHSDTLRRLLYFTKWQRHFKSSLTSMQEETDSITLESRTCQTLKLEKYLQLQNGRRERGHAWEGGVAHPLPGSTCFLSSTAPSLYLLCASSLFTHSLSSSSSSVSSSPLLAAVVIPSSSPCPGSVSQRACVCVCALGRTLMLCLPTTTSWRGHWINSCFMDAQQLPPPQHPRLS